MSVKNLVKRLNQEGARLKVVDNKLSAKLPKGIAAELKAELIENKAEVKAYILSLMAYKSPDKTVISKRKKHDCAPLSFAQQRLWFVDQLQSGSAEYNMPIVFSVMGDLNLQVVNDVFIEIIQRHEVLRTVYIKTDQGTQQIIREQFTFTLNRHDLTALPGKDKQHHLQSLIESDVNTSFNLGDDLMLRVSYIRLKSATEVPEQKEEGVIVFNMHHIASDGWSVQVLTKEFITLYQAFIAGKTSPLNPLDIQYADYAHWQRQWLQGSMLDDHLHYWERQLALLPQVHGLLLDHTRPDTKKYAGKFVQGQLSAATSTSLLALAKRYQLTPFMLAHSALALILSLHSNNPDIVVGTAVANRMQAELEPLIGFFINTLVLRLDTSHTRLKDYFNHVRQIHLEAQTHQDVPFEQLVERLNFPRSTAISPLFQIMLTTDSDYGLNSTEESESFLLPGVSLSPESSQSIVAKYDLTINLSLTEDGGITHWIYDKSIFNETHVAQFNSHLVNLLNGLAALDVECAADVLIKDLPMQSAAELNKLLNPLNYQVEKYPRDKGIHELFEQQALLYPENIALVYKEQQLTYQELNKRANQLAHYLIAEHKVSPDTLVGLSLNRSLEMVIALLGILKAGAAYVPLDPDYPQGRLNYMLDDSKPRLLLTHSALQRQFSPLEMPCVALDKLKFQTYASDNPQVTIFTPSHLAYVIYTSGSTGQPKGVMVEHQGIVNLITMQRRTFEVTPASRFLQFASINFDASLWEWAGALCNGAKLYICSDECRLSPTLLSDYLEQEAISHAILPPVLLSYLDIERNYAFIALQTGGEACNKQQAWRWASRYPFYNLYGPSECSVLTHIGKVIPEQPVSIGNSISNTQAYVLDGQKNPVPVGVCGELYLSGDGLARGYLNQPLLTAERFIDNPYYDESQDNRCKRLYKTGDLVRYLTNGELEFIGRFDEQVKIRGFRIELGEIEQQLSLCEGVDSALVLVKENDSGNKQLLAYVKPSASHEIQRDKPSPFIVNIKQRLAATLPDYMIPEVFIPIEEWPLLPNSKVDKKALPEPDGALLQREYQAPVTETECSLAQIWSGLFNIDSEKISTASNFFELGGHSLLSVRVISEIRLQLSVELPVKAIFEAPTIRALAMMIDTAAGNTLRPGISARVHAGNTQALSFAQQRLWFIDRLQSGSPEYNMAAAFKVEGELDLNLVQRALVAIIERHQILRTVYLESEDGVMQRIQHRFDFKLSRYDLSTLTAQQQETELSSVLKADIEKPFNLSEDLMLRAGYILLNPEKSEDSQLQQGVFFFNLHHIASDGWSMAILTKEFFTLYQAFIAGEENPLAELEIQYADYAHWQRQWLQSQELETQLTYWDRQLADLPPVHSLPLDTPRPAVKQHQGGVVSGQLSAEVAMSLKKLAQSYQLTPFMLMHSALALLLSHHSNNQDIVIGTPMANRMQAELEPLIGFFVNTLVLRLNTDYLELADYLGHVRQIHLDAQTHQDVSLEQLVERLNIPRSTEFSPLFQVMLTTDSDFSQEHGETSLTLPGVNLSPLSPQSIAAKFDLTVNISLNDNGVFIHWVYDTAIFSAVHIEQFNSHLMRLLNGLSSLDIERSAYVRIKDLPMQSDGELNYLLNSLNSTAEEYPGDKCMHALFEQQVLLYPENIALVFKEQQLTYQELNKRANQLAHYLNVNHNVGPDTLVGVSLNRSLDMIIALLAILKAGGAYVPLDPDYPPGRLNYMLTDSKPRLLLTNSSLQGLFSPLKLPCIALDHLNLNGYASDNPQIAKLTPSHLAYVIYTSGSTGQPKGVMVEHQGLVSLLTMQRRRFEVTSDSRFLLFASISFDASLWEWAGAICNGAKLYVCSDECRLSPSLLGDYLEQEAISHAALPQVLLSYLDVERNYAFSALFTGGEACHEQQAWRWASRYPFYNVYGPTESSVITHIAKVIPECPVSIGSSVSNIQSYVLDGQQKPVPVGVCGELYLSGDGLARGYLNQPRLTAERFIDNPYYDVNRDIRCKRLYKTGDLVRYLASGELEFIGRVDEQVKIRGFRIELGEVEQQLSLLEAVDSALVLAKENDSGLKQLLAYVKPSAAQELQGQDDGNRHSSFIAEIKPILAGTLPDYMMPDIFIPIVKWPQLPNGKVDKKALPEPALLQGEYLAPVTVTEKALVQIWSGLLNIDSDKISTTSSFFELGGHSLLSVRMVTEIRKILALELPVKTVFEDNTIQLISRRIDHLGKACIEQLNREIDTSLLINLGQDLTSNSTIYCIPGIAGLAHTFSDLAKQLPADLFNVKGFNHQGLLGNKAPFDSIEENVTHFINEMMQDTCNEPYIILGHSYGGVIALEIAIRLKRQNIDVKVIMLDSYFQQKSVQRIDTNNIDKALCLDNPEDVVFARKIEDVYQQQARLFSEYEIEVIEGIEILFLFAQETTIDLEHYLHFLERIMQQVVSYDKVAGDHMGMLNNHGASQIAEKIVNFISNTKP